MQMQKQEGRWTSNFQYVQLSVRNNERRCTNMSAISRIQHTFLATPISTFSYLSLVLLALLLLDTGWHTYSLTCPLVSIANSRRWRDLSCILSVHLLCSGHISLKSSRPSRLPAQPAESISLLANARPDKRSMPSPLQELLTTCLYLHFGNCRARIKPILYRTSK